MSLSILDYDSYQSGSGGYLPSHTLAALNAAGSNTGVIGFGFNRNPVSEITSRTANGNAMTHAASSINTNVVAVRGYYALLNNASVDIVHLSPYKLEAIIGVAVAGLDQSTPIAGSLEKTTDTYTAAATLSYTGTPGNMLLVAVAAQGSRTITPVGVTQLQNFDHGDGAIGQCFVGYVEATGSPQTVGGNLNSADNVRVLVIELASATGTIDGTSNRSATMIGAYASPTIAESINLNSDLSAIIESATLMVIDATTPGDSYIEYELTANGGVDWESVTPGTPHTFANTGGDIRWRALMYPTTDGQNGPTISELSVAWESVSGTTTSAGRSAVITGEVQPVQYLYSTQVNVGSDSKVHSAVLHEVDVSTPSDSSISWHLSNDGGSTWESVTPGIEHVFSSVGTDLRWRATLAASSDLQDYPILSEISVVWINSTDAEASRAATILGAVPANDSRSAKIEGVQTAVALRSAIMVGYDVADDTRAAYVRGKLFANDAINAVTNGIGKSDAERSATTRGYATANAARGAVVTGVRNPPATRWNRAPHKPAPHRWQRDQLIEH